MPYKFFGRDREINSKKILSLIPPNHQCKHTALQPHQARPFFSTQWNATDQQSYNGSKGVTSDQIGKQPSPICSRWVGGRNSTKHLPLFFKTLKLPTFGSWARDLGFTCSSYPVTKRPLRTRHHARQCECSEDSQVSLPTVRPGDVTEEHRAQTQIKI